MAELALEGVCKSFADNVDAVRNLDLTIRDRELMVLVGPSGCGKTTTLRLIAGLENPSRGVIRIGRRVVNRESPRDRDIAMMFQAAALYPHLSVFGNMAFGLRLRDRRSWMRKMWLRLRSPAMARREARRQQALVKKVRSAARVLRIEHLLGRRPRQLSGGERQRVALGRVIVRRPAAFLFDEPLSNLDAPLRVELRRALKLMHQRLRTTTVIVTHDQAEAMALGDRIAVMDRGQIQQIGTPEEVYKRPRNRFVAEFLGEPAMNFIRGCWQPAHGRLRFVGGGLTLDVTPGQAERLSSKANDPLILGIRPEHIALAGPTLAPADRPRLGDHFAGDGSGGCGQVVMVEKLGETTLLTLAISKDSPKDKPKNFRPAATETDGELLVVSAPAHNCVEVGAEVTLRIDASRAYFFDARTGENLIPTG